MLFITPVFHMFGVFVLLAVAMFFARGCHVGLVSEHCLTAGANGPGFYSDSAINSCHDLWQIALLLLCSTGMFASVL